MSRIVTINLDRKIQNNVADDLGGTTDIWEHAEYGSGDSTYIEFLDTNATGTAVYEARIDPTALDVANIEPGPWTVHIRTRVVEHNGNSAALHLRLYNGSPFANIGDNGNRSQNSGDTAWHEETQEIASAVANSYTDQEIFVALINSNAADFRIQISEMWVVVPNAGLDTTLATFSPTLTAPDEIEKTDSIEPTLATFSPTLTAPDEVVDDGLSLRPTMASFSPPLTELSVILGGTDQFYGVLDDFQLGIPPAMPDLVLEADEEARTALTEEILPENVAVPIDVWRFDTGTGTDVYSNPGGGSGSATGELQGTAQWVTLGGDRDLAGQPKRRVLGRRRQVKGTLIDEQRLVWQVGTGSFVEIIPTEGGKETLTPAGDETNIYDSTPGAGEYSTQLSAGLVRLQSEPASVLAFNVREKIASKNTAGAIARRIAEEAGGMEVDLNTCDLIAAHRRGEVGWSSGDSRASYRDALRAVMASADGWFAVSPTGLFSLGQRHLALDGQLGGTAIDLTDDDLERRGPQDGDVAHPAGTVAVRWAPFEVTMNLEDVTGSIPEGEREKFTLPYREAFAGLHGAMCETFEDSHPVAPDLEIEGLYDGLLFAREDATRRHDLDQFRMEVVELPTVHRVNQYVALTAGTIVRYTGRASGNVQRTMILAGWNRQAGSGNVTLICLGPAAESESDAFKFAERWSLIREDTPTWVPSDEEKGKSWKISDEEDVPGLVSGASRD